MTDEAAGDTQVSDQALARAPYTAGEVDAAVRRLLQPGCLAHAEQIVAHAAPSLQAVLAQALRSGGWFSEAHETQVAAVAQIEDEHERTRAVSALLEEETHLGMLVGVAVGFELAHQLELARQRGHVPDTTAEDGLS
jgi:hypothetical protein